MALHYIEAGNIMDRMTAPGAKPFSLKKLLYNKKDSKVSVGAVYALVTETLKYKKVIDSLLDTTGIMENKDLHGKGHILHVMIFDLLFGKAKAISGGGTLKKIIITYTSRLQSELVKMKLKYKIKDITELIPEHLRTTIVLPRWVRINTLKGDMKTAKYFFDKDGWKEIPFDDFFKQLDDLQAAQKGDEKEKKDKRLGKVYCHDRDLPDLLAFPPMTDFHDHQLLLSGHMVLQDKASALSGAALEVPASQESVALDACAAPGQKTSQVAQTMRNMGRLFAFDLDMMRLETLKKLCKRNGLKNLTAVNSSFLDIDVHSEPYCDVEYILLDPSCSGSGIVNRLDYFLASNTGDEYEAGSSDAASGPPDENSVRQRALKLQEFQLSMIKKAFTFPRLRRLVYSTCSIHDEENEQVVEKALTLSKHFQAAKVLPQVPMRGKAEYPHGELCIRTVPSRDHTIGFFVSLFERIGDLPQSKKRKAPTPDDAVVAAAAAAAAAAVAAPSNAMDTTPTVKSTKKKEEAAAPASKQEELVSPSPAKKRKIAETSDADASSSHALSKVTQSVVNTTPANKNKNKNKNKKPKVHSRPLVR